MRRCTAGRDRLVIRRAHRRSGPAGDSLAAAAIASGDEPPSPAARKRRSRRASTRRSRAARARWRSSGARESTGAPPSVCRWRGLAGRETPSKIGTNIRQDQVSLWCRGQPLLLSALGVHFPPVSQDRPGRNPPTLLRHRLRPLFLRHVHSEWSGGTLPLLIRGGDPLIIGPARQGIHVRRRQSRGRDRLALVQRRTRVRRWNGPIDRVMPSPPSPTLGRQCSRHRATDADLHHRYSVPSPSSDGAARRSSIVASPSHRRRSASSISGIR